MRALLIGSGYADLPVVTGVDAMFACLRGHGFDASDIQRISGEHATREAMLAGLDHLARDDPGDAPVVFYYAGHGHLYRTEIGAGGEGHAAHPLLVAIDLDTSQGGALHGVLGSELSRSLQAVARRARNLTVILDCCHASAMVRLDDDLEDPDIYAQERDLQIEASARISKRRGPVCRGGHVGPRERLSERVVVLAASSAGGRMYPHPVTKRLVFTDALIAALAQFTTWDEVLADVRAEVQAVWPTQHPAVFGPRFRQPFALVEHLPEGELFRVEQRGAQTVLLAGKLAGIHPEDELEVLTCATTSPDRESVLGVVRPWSIQPEHTVLRPAGATRIPQPCYARRIRRGERPVVAIACDDADLARTLTRIAGHAGFDVAEDESTATIELSNGTVRVRDCLGELVHVVDVRDLEDDELRRCLRRLDVWRGTARWLRGDSSGRPLKHCYSLRWGSPGSTGPVLVRPGDALTLELHNLDHGAPSLYSHAFRVRADREVRGWRAETGAQHLAAHQHLGAGPRRASDPRAFILDAPPALPPGLYREWTLVVVSNAPFDIDPFETPVDARALSSAFGSMQRQIMRGEDHERLIDIVAFPYTLDRR